jgi:hypothetical protein
MIAANDEVNDQEEHQWEEAAKKIDMGWNDCCWDQRYAPGSAVRSRQRNHAKARHHLQLLVHGSYLSSLHLPCIKRSPRRHCVSYQAATRRDAKHPTKALYLA